MTRDEHNKFAMLQAALAVCKDHPDIINPIPSFAESVVTADESLTELLRLDNEYTAVDAGATMDKNVAFEDLANRVKPVIDGLFLFGNKSGNEQLKAECRLSRTRLRRMRPNALHQLCVRIVSFAGEHADNLIPYGLTSGGYRGSGNRHGTVPGASRRKKRQDDREQVIKATAHPSDPQDEQTVQ